MSAAPQPTTTVVQPKTYRLIVKGSVENARNVAHLALHGGVEIVDSRQLRDGICVVMVRDREARYNFCVFLNDWASRDRGPAREGSLLLWAVYP